MRLSIKYKTKDVNQKGLASVIIVFTLITLIAAISLGFARLMNRSLQNSVNSQLSAAAEFAAQSGISDAAAYVQANPTRTVNQCGELITDSGGLKFGTIAVADLSGDQIVRYTCMLVDPSPKDVVRQNIPPWESFVVRLSTSSPADSFMFSWQSTDRSKTGFVNGQQDFFNENEWGARGLAPVLKVSLFQVNSTTSAVGSENKTFYLYPNQGSGQFGSVSYGQPSGEKANGNCDTDPAPQTAPPSIPFSGEANYDCNTVISGLQAPPPDWTYYAKITPFYNNTDIRIQANGGNSLLNFNNVQSVVDVTAKANSAVKRLQARVAVNDPNNIEAGTDNMPENALRSANAICKRLVLPDGSSTIQIDGSSQACNFVNQTLPPTVVLTANPATVTVGGSSTLTWVTTNDPTDCTASGDWSGNKNPAGDNESTGVLNTARDYIYTLTCTNSAGGGSDTATVTVTGSGGGGGCSNQSGGSGNFPPNACARDFSFVGWAGSGSATFRVWASHCYSNLNINGTNISWNAVPDDNSTYYNYTIGFNNAGGTARVTCSGNGTSWIEISVPPFGNSNPPSPPPPQCPSPPGSGPCNTPPPPPPYIVYWDCHPVSNFYWIWEHWSDGQHINTGAGTPNFCAV